MHDKPEGWNEDMITSKGQIKETVFCMSDGRDEFDEHGFVLRNAAIRQRDEELISCSVNEKCCKQLNCRHLFCFVYFTKTLSYELCHCNFFSTY